MYKSYREYLFKSTLKDYDQKKVDELYHRLLSFYKEDHRYYHNIVHIDDCVNRASHIASQLDNPDCVLIALWFHDCIYNPLEVDNEHQSKLIAVEALNDIGVDSKTVQLISDLIMITEHSQVPKNNDERFMVDIDLNILGAIPSVYYLYEYWIRQEYSMVAFEVYSQKRCEILKSFLERDRIYSTDAYQEKYEEQARKNLSHTVNLLENVPETEKDFFEKLHNDADYW